MRLMAVLSVSLALCSCQSSQQRDAQLAQLAASDDQRCAEMGYTKGTALYLQCRQLQTANREAQHAADDRSREDFGSRLQAAGAALGSISPPPPRTTNCNPTFNGGMNCTTF